MDLESFADYTLVLHGQTVFYGKGYNILMLLQISTQFGMAINLACQQSTEMTTEFTGKFVKKKDTTKLGEVWDCTDCRLGFFSQKESVDKKRTVRDRWDGLSHGDGTSRLAPTPIARCLLPCKM